MASDESHDDIIAEVRARWQGCEDVSLAELDGRDLLALIDRLKAAHKRELDRCAIIAGASLADVVEEKYKREIAELQDEILRLKDIIVDERAQHTSAEARKNAELEELREALRSIKQHSNHGSKRP